MDCGKDLRTDGLEEVEFQHQEGRQFAYMASNYYLGILNYSTRISLSLGAMTERTALGPTQTV